MADHLFTDDTRDVEGKFIGWDYAHAGDYAGYYGDKGILADEKKWTTQEIFEEVKDACYQLKQLEEESPADKMFEELGYIKEEHKNCIEYFRGKNEDEKAITLWRINEPSIASYSGITMQELKAINKKCEELGWTNE